MHFPHITMKTWENKEASVASAEYRDKPLQGTIFLFLSVVNSPSQQGVHSVDLLKILDYISTVVTADWRG